jgi:hypothetical protein
MTAHTLALESVYQAALEWERIESAPGAARVALLAARRNLREAVRAAKPQVNGVRG